MNPSDIGLAGVTAASRASGLAVMRDVVRRTHGIELEEFTDDDAAKPDALKELVLVAINDLVQNTLMKTNGAPYDPASVAKYISSLMTYLRQRFPNSNDLKTADTTENNIGWYTVAMAGFRKGVKRKNSRSDRAVSVRCRGIMKRCDNEMVRAQDRIVSGPGVRGALDLEKVAFLIIAKDDRAANVFPGCGPYMQRLLVMLDYEAVGRAGEVKFLSWLRTTYDPYFHSPDFSWVDIKNAKVQPCMLFSPDRYGYMCDIFHCFGAYFAVENGLYRSSSDSPLVANYVFPLLHSCNDARVATIITDILKAHVDKSIKSDTTSRSLRKGATTMLGTVKGISEPMSNDRGGWSTGVVSDTYKASNPAINLPPSRALNGWPRPLKYAFPPTLYALVSQDKTLATKFMEELYTTNLPYFQVDGDLYPFLETCTAALIMYYPNLVCDFPKGNMLTRKLLTKMTKITEDPHVVLCKWSATIRTHFDERNKPQFASKTARLEAKVDRLQSTVESMQDTMAALTAIIHVATFGSSGESKPATEELICDSAAHTVQSMSRTEQVVSAPPGPEPERSWSPVNDDDLKPAAVSSPLQDEMSASAGDCEFHDPAPVKRPATVAFAQGIVNPYSKKVKKEAPPPSTAIPPLPGRSALEQGFAKQAEIANLPVPAKPAKSETKIVTDENIRAARDQIVGTKARPDKLKFFQLIPLLHSANLLVDKKKFSAVCMNKVQGSAAKINAALKVVDLVCALKPTYMALFSEAEAMTEFKVSEMARALSLDTMMAMNYFSAQSAGFAAKNVTIHVLSDPMWRPEKNSRQQATLLAIGQRCRDMKLVF